MVGFFYLADRGGGPVRFCVLFNLLLGDGLSFNGVPPCRDREAALLFLYTRANMSDGGSATPLVDQPASRIGHETLLVNNTYKDRLHGGSLTRAGGAVGSHRSRWIAIWSANSDSTLPLPQSLR